MGNLGKRAGGDDAVGGRGDADVNGERQNDSGQPIGEEEKQRREQTAGYWVELCLPASNKFVS